MFDQGDRVMTSFGPGTIVYRRMAAPDYSEAEAYSVKLDKPQTNSPTYTGTLLAAFDVKELS